MKLEVGKSYRLKNGSVLLCDRMRGDDLSAVGEFGYGPFTLNGMLYHQDGRFGDGSTPSLDVVAEWTEDDELNAIADERKDGPFVALTLPTLDGNLVCGEFTDKDGNTVKVEEKK